MVKGSTLGAAHSYYPICNIDDIAVCAARAEFIRKQATAIASDATGMNISVERIDLRFPLNLLVRGVQVVQSENDAVDVQHPDTLLNLGSLNVRVQAWPLLQGRVEVDDITLQQVAVNSSTLLEGMRIKGTLGRFFLESHGIDLKKRMPC